MELLKEFGFEAAHRLPGEHKCARLHGHSYRVVVHREGEVDPATGMVVDFAEVSQAFKRAVHAVLDHQCLNSVEGLENPTSEHLARWIWRRLRDALPRLSAIEVRETASSGCRLPGRGRVSARDPILVVSSCTATKLPPPPRERAAALRDAERADFPATTTQGCACCGTSGRRSRASGPTPGTCRRGCRA
jgi:6-pyruvoyltetrahydropterin/6-carboxytetrahydropterin synthase